MVYLDDDIKMALDKVHHAIDRKVVLKQVDQLLRTIEEDCVKMVEKKKVEQKKGGRL